MNDPRTTHASHDPLLIAAHAAGDLDGADRARATALLASCEKCALLDGDLRALASAVHDLPPANRTRTFTLSSSDAARLRPPAWRRVLAAFAGERFHLARPVGAAFASLGLAGLLLSSLPAIPLGGSAAAPANQATGYEAAPSSKDLAGSPAEAADDDRLHAAGATAPPDAQPQTVGETPAETAGPQEDAAGRDMLAPDRATNTTLVVLSGTFLIVGLGLFVLRWTARRLDDA